MEGQTSSLLELLVRAKKKSHQYQKQILEVGNGQLTIESWGLRLCTEWPNNSNQQTNH